MTTLYVREQGAHIRRKNETVRVMLKSETLQESPVRDLDQVIVYGNVQMTTQAAALLVHHDVDVVFYSQAGRFRYRLQQSGARYARLRQVQLRMADEAPRSLSLAKSIVRGKLANQERLVQTLAQRDKTLTSNEVFLRAQRGIHLMAQHCGGAGSSDALRGFEGKAAVFYFDVMKTRVPKAWGFRKREYYPPPDPWNATLSFSYSLLLKDVIAVVQLVGLDPYVGFFHALEANRPSLALDLMEEYRPLVDDVDLQLLASGKLPLERYRRNANGRRPVEIGPELLPVVIGAYEDRLEQTIRSAATGEHITVRRSLELQARQLAQVILGKRKIYLPIRLSFRV